MPGDDDQVEALLYRYAAAIDAGDFDGIGALFADGRLLDPDGNVIATGSDEVRALYEQTTRRYPDGTPRTRHVTTNAIIEVDTRAGTATSRSYFAVLQQVDDGPLEAIIAGRYHDTFRRGPDGAWAFAERRMLPELFGDLSRHLRFDPSILDRHRPHPTPDPDGVPPTGGTPS